MQSARGCLNETAACHPLPMETYSSIKQGGNQPSSHMKHVDYVYSMYRAGGFIIYYTTLVQVKHIHV